jgi:hypothetical protein
LAFLVSTLALANLESFLALIKFHPVSHLA